MSLDTSSLENIVFLVALWNGCWRHSRLLRWMESLKGLTWLYVLLVLNTRVSTDVWWIKHWYWNKHQWLVNRFRYIYFIEKCFPVQHELIPTILQKEQLLKWTGLCPNCMLIHKNEMWIYRVTVICWVFVSLKTLYTVLLSLLRCSSRLYHFLLQPPHRSCLYFLKYQTVNPKTAVMNSTRAKTISGIR